MTDERLCTVCGGYENMVAHAEVYSYHHSYHPFEAAPSTDEGEARPPGAFEITWDRMLGGYGGYRVSIPMYGGGWVVPLDELAAIRAPLEERIRLVQLDADNGRTALYGLTEQFNKERQAKRTAETKLEAAEERIRELEAQLQVAEANQDTLARAFDADGQIDRLEAENERLREALRPLVAAYDGGDLECPHFHFCPAHPDRVRNVGPCNCGAGEVETAIESARALATPPSSTEGTK